MRIREAPAAPQLLAALVSGLIALVLWLAAETLATGASPALGASPPSVATTRFLGAYASADERLADALASPLYRAEWARRGLGAEDRMALRGTQTGSASPVVLHFDYVGGVRTSEGFSHLLYVAWPIREGVATRGAYSAWRVDADPEGRVVWLELVWLFEPDTRAVTWKVGADSLADVPVPAEIAKSGLGPVAGVVSEDTGEGHYLLGPKAGTASCESPSTSVSTYGVDASGSFRPGAWTFGYGDQSLGSYPPRKGPAPRIRVEPEDELLLEGYLRVLG